MFVLKEITATLSHKIVSSIPCKWEERVGRGVKLVNLRSTHVIDTECTDYSIISINYKLINSTEFMKDASKFFNLGSFTFEYFCM